jgi:hypothetical protein
MSDECYVPLHPSMLSSSRPLVRFFLASAALSLCGTFFFAQIDFFRRHQPGISPEKYWLPQLYRIWAPGLALVFALLLLALALERWGRRE